tara:strand:+ start:874 stop:1827 length:954 start_codon:yes stop_codon:yes gene_type:complete
MSKFFQSEIAAYGGEKQTFQNVKFKKSLLHNSTAAEAGTILEIIPVHIKNPPVIQFIAYIDSLSDSFNTQYSSEQPFGRTNPYYVWKGNKRSINVSWSLPASSKAMALNNLNNLSWFLSSTYPSFKQSDTATSISASPLFRVRYANLISSPSSDGQGLLCVMQNVSVNTDPNAGFISIKPEGLATPDQANIEGLLISNAGFTNSVHEGKNLLIPKLIKLSTTLDVVHDHALGWDHHTGEWRGGRSARNYPYDFGLLKEATDTPSTRVEVYEDTITPGAARVAPGSTEARQKEVVLNDLGAGNPDAEVGIEFGDFDKF